MITGVAVLQVHALKEKGWSVSAIARHVGHDRKTVRAYLAGVREPGVRRKPAAAVDPMDRFGGYVAQRLADDPHVWATVLFEEVVALGFGLSYSSFTRLLRQRGLRPHCEACHGVKGRATIELDHPPGVEIQWDWLELPEAPWGGKAHVLLGSLPFSGRFRGVFADSEEQAQLIWAIHQVLERLGGTAKRWRVDRLATVIRPGTADVQPSFVPVARHYGVEVDPCPPRRGNRKGSVEKSIHYMTQRWWRTAPVTTMAEAQAALDRFCARVADQRTRPVGRYSPELLATIGSPERPRVGMLALLEKLAPLPAPFPATVESVVKVGPSALARFAGNSYSVPVGLLGAQVTCSWRIGTSTLQITSEAGTVVATHRLAPRGCGQIVRSTEHAAQLEKVVLGAFSTDRPCPAKPHRPPSPAALAEAERLRHDDASQAVVVDLAAYQAAVDEREAAR